MDPERVRAYLQVACAGLGFDIGEVWWTSNESGNSTVAAIGKLFPSFLVFTKKENTALDTEGQLTKNVIFEFAVL